MSEYCEKETFTLDNILRKIGKFGVYQIFIYSLISYTLLVTGTSVVGFVFTAGNVNHYCKIQECQYDNYELLKNAIPFNKNNIPESCYHYNLINKINATCDKNNFDRTSKYACNEWIYDNTENTIVKEFNLVCDNKWKAPLVGSLHFVGHLINLIVSGYFSDRYGRRALLIFSTLACGILGVARSFSWNYNSFLILEIFDSLLNAGLQNAAFVLGVEILSPELRAFGGVLILSAASFGMAYLGLSALWIKDWRNLLRFNSSLSFGILFFFWLIPDSFRWLLLRGEHKKVGKYLLKAAKWNKIKLSDSMNDVLRNRTKDILLDDKKKEIANNLIEYNFRIIFKYPVFCVRIIICIFCWFTNIFVFYGLSLTSVTIGGNKFTDFIWVALTEIPGAFISFLGVNRFGRKKLLIGGLIGCGIALLVSAFIPNVYWIKLTLFLIGKLTISISFSTIYIFTSELFPTNLRNTIFGLCSGIGRLGSIIATQTSILESIYEKLPVFLFAGLGLLAALLSFSFPETKNTQLPDTIEDSLNIGKKQFDNKKDLNLSS